jgi:uncharacterized membrane protein
MEAIDFFVDNKILFVIIHVLFVIAGMGSALLSDFLFNFYSKDKVLNETEIKSLSLLSRIVWISLIFIILSGIALFFSDPEKYTHSQKFISKMCIMGVLLLNGLFLSQFISPHLNDRGLLKFKNKRTLRQISFICGAISIASWTIVCILGTLKSIPMHSTRFILYYVVFILCSALIALFVEKKAFSNY